MGIRVPQHLIGFVLGFSPKDPALTCLAGIHIAGYFWALVAQMILRSFAAACLRGWS